MYSYGRLRYTPFNLINPNIIYQRYYYESYRPELLTTHL